MQRLAIYLLVAFFVFASGFFTGREWRDRSADVDTAQRDVSDAQGATKAVAVARTTDHTQAASSAAVETVATRNDAKAAVEFRTITREVIRYVTHNPQSDIACLDGDGLRLWNAANEGDAASLAAEPASRPGAIGAGSTITAAGQ